VAIGQGLGYGLLGLAVAGFGAGAVLGFGPLVTVIVIGALLAMTVVLAPAIVFGFGVRAAEREDRRARS